MRLVGRASEQTNATIFDAPKAGEAQNVFSALLRPDPGPVAVGKFGRVGERKPRRAARADQLDQALLDRRRPPADHVVEPLVQGLDVGCRRLLVDILGVANQGEVAFAGLNRPAGDLPPDHLFEHRADRFAALRVHVVSRQPDEGKQLALEDAANQQERGPGAIRQRHRHHHQVANRLPVDVDQQVARKG